MPNKICPAERCTGCFACMNICPRDAIVCKTDQYGKTIPEICRSKCIECGLCVKVCPENQPVDKKFPVKCYAAWSKDDKERENCSSGGIATGFSHYVINESGIVYGAAFDQDLKLIHMSADKQEETEKFKGSKYVQSYTGIIYRKIQEQLKAGSQILFIGTPCQTAGLKSYFGGKEYDNLLLVDLICHGTPPMEYLREHIRRTANGRKVTGISFRGKKDWRLTLYNGNRSIYSVRSKQDPYFLAFLKGMIYRDNCYRCQYAVPERVSDITIGDFWGLDRTTLKSQYTGNISVVLINTEKGDKFWDKVKGQFYWEPRPVKEAIEGNAQLKRPSVCHPERALFLENYLINDFNSAVRTPSLKKELAENRIKHSMPYRTAHKIKQKLRRKK